MNNRLFLSVAAAALITSSGLSYAQAPVGGTPAAGGAPAERAAPSGGAASERPAQGGGGAMNRDAAEPRGGAPKQSMQNDEAPGAKGDTKGGMKNADTKNGMNKNADTKGGMDKNADTKGGMNKNADTKGGDDKTMNRNADSKDGARDGGKNAQTKDGADKTTTGQAAAGGKQLTTEQRTKVTSVIKQQNVRPVTNINFAISVGTRVPRDVRFNPLPAEIITVYPDWRGYEFFLARDEIIVVNPRTLEIVAVLPA